MADLNHLCFNCFKDRGNFEVCPHCGFVAGTPTEQTYYLVQGSVLAGRYIIGNVIGLGGFGITYKALDAKLEKIVAVKEFYPSGMVNRPRGAARIDIFTQSQLGNYNQMLERFATEARNMALFSKEQDIVAVYDYFEENQTGYIVMEYMEGILLKKYLKDYGQITPEDALPVFLEILKAIGKLHAQGVIHRDISPDNIFLGEENHIKLFDFGAASFRDDRDPYREIVIKAGYTPPEQYRKDNAPKVTQDIYSAGALFYEMLTGKRPLEATDRILEDGLEKPSDLGVTISENLENAIMKALALDPEQRFQTIQEFHDTLAESRKVEIPDPRAGRSGRVWRWIAGIVAAAAVITAGVLTGLYKSNILNYVPKDGTTLKVWLAQDDSQVEDQTITKEIENNIASGFEEKYPGVKVDITFIPQSEYAKKISSTAADKRPDVYCTDYLPKEQKQRGKSLKPLISHLDSVTYLFEDTYKEAYPDMLEIPVGFQLAAYYRNTSKEALSTKTDHIELANVKKEVGSSACAWVDTRVENSDIYTTLRKKKENKQDVKLNAVAGSLSCWNEIQDATISNDKKSVELQIVPIVEDGKLLCSLNNCYAVRAGDDSNIEKTGMLFLYYLLGNSAQRELSRKQNDMIPINARAYQTYLENLSQYQIQYIEDNIIVTEGESIDIRLNNVTVDSQANGIYQECAE